MVARCRGVPDLEIWYECKDAGEEVEDGEMLRWDQLAEALQGHNLRSFMVHGDTYSVFLPRSVL